MTVAQRQGDSDVPTLKLVIESLGVKLLARDFDTSVAAYLGGIYVQHMLFKGQCFKSSQAAFNRIVCGKCTIIQNEIQNTVPIQCEEYTLCPRNSETPKHFAITSGNLPGFK